MATQSVIHPVGQSQPAVVVPTTSVPRSARGFVRQLKAFFVTAGIATDACFDRWVWEAIGQGRAHHPSKVVSFRRAPKRAQRQKTAR